MALLTSRRGRWLVVAAGVIVLAVAGTVVFRGVGQWLVVEDPLNQAQAIVVLSGRLPERALEAARVFRAGYAGQVWVSQPFSPADELKQMKIAYLGEDFYNEKVLLAQGVPLDAITILEHPVSNTEQEVREITAFMRREKVSTVIVVTSKAHTRRVRAIWHKLAPSDLHLIVHYADDDPYDGPHWWRHTQDALDVSREVLGLVNAWSGFPVRPSHD